MNERLQDLLNSVQRTAGQMGGVAADAAYGVGRKAGELLSTGKLRIQIATMEGQVEGCLAEIGEMMYATHTGVPTDSEELLEKLREIDGLKAHIAELNAQIDQARQSSLCPVCGAAVCPGDVFCRECGGKL